MKYKMEFIMDNADFIDDYDRAIETVMETAKVIMQRRESIAPLYDRNGIKIGLMELQSSNKNMDHI